MLYKFKSKISSKPKILKLKFYGKIKLSIKFWEFSYITWYFWTYESQKKFKLSINIMKN
jgi:hypothetical protein